MKFALASLTLALVSAPALAQPAITWFTIDCGGTTSTGGALTLKGTIGQPDATLAPEIGGGLSLTGGYWAAVPRCPADFNDSGTVTVQDIFDFLAAWFAGDPRANVNGLGGVTVQDIFDFLSLWFAGCP